MKFSREYLDQLKEAIDLVDLIGDYTDLQKAGPFLYVGHCPHPNHKDSDASFRVNTKTNTWCCYGCHSDKKNKQEGSFGSDCIAFIEWISNGEMSWLECIKYLAEKANMPLPVEKHEKQYKTNYAITQKFKRDMNDESLEYLYERGISDKEIEEWSIGYDKAENRIVFPLIDSCKNIIGFNKRLLTKETKGISKKYVHSSDSEVFKKSNYLYGMHNINNTCNYIVLSEGVFDVILSRKYGLKNVVCALGTSLSDYQMELLAKQKKEVIVVYDNDKKGLKTMKKVLPLLEEKNIPAKLLLLPEGKDLADSALMLKYDIEDYILNNSITYGYYKLQDTVNMFNRDLYNLYNKYNSIFKDIENSVPESEKHTIAAFINNNIYNKEISINAMR